MKKLLGIVGLLLAACLPAAAQNGVRYDNYAFVTITGGNAILAMPGALVTVCTSAATGNPCSPTAPIYSDAALTLPITLSQVTADAGGNFGFYIPPGRYTYSLRSPSGLTGSFVFTAGPVLDGANTWTQPNTFSAAMNANGGGALVGTFSGNYTTTGNNTHSGTETFCQLNGMYVAGTSCYPTISSAVTAAGATGSVLIPANYAGTDVVPVLNGISIDDRRVTNGLNETRIWSVIAPSFPVTNFPGGNDLVLRTRGSADSYREHLVTKTTTATALNVGANNNILVAAVTVGNLTRGTIQTGDTSLLGNPSILGLSIGRDTANAEVVLGGSWSVVDATHLNITCAKSHASIVDIDLGAGDLLLSFGTLIINSAVVKATQTSTYNPPLVINDSTGTTIGKWPTNRADIWPYSAWQFSAPITGGYSGGVDLYLRALTAAAKLQYWDFAGAEKLWEVSNDGIWLINGNASARPNLQLNHDSASGNGAQTIWQYNGATSLLIAAQADTPHIYGGGTSSGISFYGSSGGTGTSGLIRFRNNGTDETQKASLDTGTGNFRSVTLLSDQGNVCTNGELALSAGWQSTGSATVTAVQGTGQTCSWTITTGTTTATNPTITDTLTNALPTATTVCWMNIYGGTHTAVAGESLRQTTLSATAPIFTANFTPTAAGTTYFVTRGCGP